MNYDFAKYQVEPPLQTGAASAKRRVTELCQHDRRLSNMLLKHINLPFQ